MSHHNHGNLYYSDRCHRDSCSAGTGEQLDVHPLQRMLSANAQWSVECTQMHPEFFTKLEKEQYPHTLWIGCADSRVPESVITNSQPGDIFVHRNIANQIPLNDDNTLSVLEYAINFLGVEHVIIVGHSNCGGAAACLDAAQSPSFCIEQPIKTIRTLPSAHPLNRWLEPLTKLAASLKLSSVPAAEALPVLVEENVLAQVENLAKIKAIQDAWKSAGGKGQAVWIHGWVYDLHTGLLRDLNVSRGPRNI